MAVYQYLVPIHLPITDNLLFLNQQKRENFSMKECAGCKGRPLERMHTKWTRYRPSYGARYLIDKNWKVLGANDDSETKVLSTTVMTLNIWTDRSGQTVQTQIRLLLKEQSDQGLHCLLFHLFDKGLPLLFEF